MNTRVLSVPGFTAFLIPADGEVSRHSAICATDVLNGEYAYPREAVEDVHTVLDIGCNLGAFVVWASKWWLGPLTFECYDPNEEACVIARGNTLALAASIHAMAVTIAEAPMFRVQDNWGGSRTWQETEGVHVPAMHPRHLPPCDVLKMDCEGCELEIFEHYRHLDRCKVVLYEYHTAGHKRDINTLLEGRGFRCVKRGTDPTQSQEVWVK